MGTSGDIPEVIKEARRLNRNAAIAIWVWSLGWVPLMILDAHFGIDFGYSAVGWLAGGGLLAALTPWSKLGPAYTLLEEYKKRTAKNLLEDAIGPEPELDADHPLAGIAERVRGLADGDQRVLDVVDTLLVKVGEVEHDLASLTAALEAEQSLGATDEDQRIQRLNAVAIQKKAVLEKLAGGLRDLHVELTVRKNEDHGGLLSAVSNMLDGIAAETEVEQAMVEATVPAPAPTSESSEDVDRKRDAQRHDAQKERS